MYDATMYPEDPIQLGRLIAERKGRLADLQQKQRDAESDRDEAEALVRRIVAYDALGGVNKARDLALEAILAGAFDLGPEHVRPDDADKAIATIESAADAYQQAKRAADEQARKVAVLESELSSLRSFRRGIEWSIRARRNDILDASGAYTGTGRNERDANDAPFEQFASDTHYWSKEPPF